MAPLLEDPELEVIIQKVLIYLMFLVSFAKIL